MAQLALMVAAVLAVSGIARESQDKNELDGVEVHPHAYTAVC